ncbi:MAG: hypothetical protein IJ309_00080 [Clostridia bacterium]|nr:hypothetical protein [Clostridia bacterium]
MAIWYEVEHTETGIHNFMECNWYFHDFKIERINYSSNKNTVEIFLKYDELEGSVILQFVNVHSMNVNFKVEFGSSEDIIGSVLLLTDNNRLLWIADDSWGEQSAQHIDELKNESSWIEAENIIWAVTDENGNPTEMPANKIDQIGVFYGKTEHHHFDLTPYIEFQ